MSIKAKAFVGMPVICLCMQKKIIREPKTMYMMEKSLLTKEFRLRRFIKDINGCSVSQALSYISNLFTSFTFSVYIAHRLGKGAVHFLKIYPCLFMLTNCSAFKDSECNVN